MNISVNQPITHGISGVRLDQTTLPEAVEAGKSYMQKIRELVSRILLQMNRISENERKETSSLKHKYHATSRQSAEYERKIGAISPVTTALGFGVALAAVMVKHPDDQALLKFLGDQFSPAASSLLTSQYRAAQMGSQSVRDLTMQDIQNKGQKTGSEGNAKQEYLALLNAVNETLKRASN